MTVPGGIVLWVCFTGCLEAPHDPATGGASDGSVSNGDASAASCTVSDFSDDFNDDDLWSVWSSSFEHQEGMLATVSQHGVITLPEVPAWAGFVSPERDLVGTCTYGEVIDVPNLAVDSAAEAWFSLSSGEGSGVYFRLTRNQLTCNERNNNELTSIVDLSAFDPVAHRWWRLRDEGNGTMACDVSPDGRSWSRLGGVDLTLDLSSAQIVWMAGTWEAMEDPGVFRIDNVND